MADFFRVSHGNNGVQTGFYKSKNRIESHAEGLGRRTASWCCYIRFPLRRKKLPVLGQVNYN